MVERGGARLALAGTDDLTAAGSGIPGHRSDLPAALAGIPADVPVVLVAHQPKEVREAAAAGVDLQLSGHTHGGPDLAVPADRAGGTGRTARTFPARPADPALHHPRCRVLGPTVPGLRTQRDQPADPALRTPSAKLSDRALSRFGE